MIDDTALFLSTENELVVLTGCGHSGILNILNYAKESLGENVYAALFS
jgi:7,8-dihydropterin-6-yl-methyl-4-(beta-D-ribofuranosyl)aminobenzene 5'-phosphate synthase